MTVLTATLAIVSIALCVVLVMFAVQDFAPPYTHAKPLPPPSPPTSAPVPAVVAVAPPAMPTPTAVVEAVEDTPVTLWGAVRQYKSRMGDEYTGDKMPEGARLLGWWAMKHLRWWDFSELPKTKFALALKDPEEERGKVLCDTGLVFEILVERIPDMGKIAHVGVTTRGDVYQFVAVGDTGKIVEGSKATFCGVLVGKWDYPNSGGGTTHALRLVGMFDLPANRLRLSN